MTFTRAHLDNYLWGCHRHVVLPQEIAKLLPPGVLLSEVCCQRDFAGLVKTGSLALHCVR